MPVMDALDVGLLEVRVNVGTCVESDTGSRQS